MTWLDEAVERAGSEDWQVVSLTPEKFFSLAEVVKAAELYLRGTAGDPTRGMLQDALARLEEL